MRLSKLYGSICEGYKARDDNGVIIACFESKNLTNNNAVILRLS